MHYAGRVKDLRARGERFVPRKQGRENTLIPV
jgi:hypothetical protein